MITRVYNTCARVSSPSAFFYDLQSSYYVARQFHIKNKIQILIRFLILC